MKCVGLLKGDCLHQCLIVQGVAGLAVGVVLANQDDRVVWLNRSAEDLLGTSLDECQGRPMVEALRSPELLTFWKEATRHGENYFAEISVRWPRPMELKLNATHCHHHATELIGRALLVCDVTNEREVQIKLSRAVADRLMTLSGVIPPPEKVARMTPQELRILRFVAGGLSNAQIAAQAHLSAATVRTHLKNLYKKLGCGSRAEAVGFAFRHHLV